jgi:hypothetical protein
MPDAPPSREPPDDAVFLRLERALHWRAAGPRPWKSTAASAAGHLTLALFWIWVGMGPPAAEQAPAVPDGAVPIFVPPAGSGPRHPQQPVVPPSANAASPRLELPGLPDEAAVNLDAVRLIFRDDTGGQLPLVVAKYGGVLALLDPDDPTIACYLFQPPDWEARKGITSVSRKLRLFMDPPRKWEVFRGLAARYRIALDRYRAGAVFDGDYGRCLQRAIRSRALSDAPQGVGPITARLAFAADRPCGIEVLEVFHATDPDAKP